MEEGCGEKGKKIHFRNFGAGMMIPKCEGGHGFGVNEELGDILGRPHPPAELDRGINGDIFGFLAVPGMLLAGKKRMRCTKNRKFWDLKGWDALKS